MSDNQVTIEEVMPKTKKRVHTRAEQDRIYKSLVRYIDENTSYQSLREVSQYDEETIMELAKIVDPQADLTYLKASAIGRSIFLGNVLKSIYHVPIDPTGKRAKHDAEVIAYNDAQDNKIDEGAARVTLAKYHAREWNANGFYPYLCMLYANNNAYRPITEESVINSSKTPLDVISVSTSRAGLTDDKGIIDFIEKETYYGVKDFADYYDLDENKVEPLLHDILVENVGKACFFKSDVLTPQLKHMLQSNKEVEKTPEQMISSMNTYTIGYSYLHLRGGSSVSYDKNEHTIAKDKPSSIMLYKYKGVLFTTTDALPVSFIDPLQQNNNLMMPCIGVIQDILFKMLTSVEDEYGYMVDDDIVPYTKVPLNAFKKVENKPIVQLSNLNFTLCREYLITNLTMPFTMAQGGWVKDSNLHVLFLDLDRIPDQISGDGLLDLLGNHSAILPTGAIYPIMQIYSSPDGLDFIVYNHLSAMPFKYSEDMYILNQIYEGTSEDDTFKYDLWFKQVEDVAEVYSQVVSKIKERVKVLLSLLYDVNFNKAETRNSNAKIQVNLTPQQSNLTVKYVCPVAIKTQEQFIL